MPLTELILTENVPGLGAEADVVKVRRGYARNYLLPRKMAYEVTPAALRQLNMLKQKRAEREAREETGLVVKAGEVLEVLDRIIPGEGGRAQYHYVLIDFLCHVTGGELLAGGDAADVAWASQDDLEKFNLEKPALQVIQKGFAQAQAGSTPGSAEV